MARTVEAKLVIEQPTGERKLNINCSPATMQKLADISLRDKFNIRGIGLLNILYITYLPISMEGSHDNWTQAVMINCYRSDDLSYCRKCGYKGCEDCLPYY